MSDALPVLREVGGDADVARLDAAWAERPTFAFLPEKSVVEEAWVRHALELCPEELKRDHFALLTSGSTGRPKLVVGARKRAEALARLLHRAQDSEPVSETLGTLPLSYCYSFVNQWLWARTRGRTFAATRGFSDPDALRARLEAARDAMLCLVGAQLALFDRHLADAVFPGVTRVHFAGGPFPQESLARVRARFPRAAVFNNYGCAEAMPRLTVRRAEDGDTGADVGAPLEGVELSVDASQALSFRSPFAAVAFVDEAGLHRVEPEAWIPTGDLAEPLDHGRWRLLGRAGEVFKRYGEKLAVSALRESVSSAWPGLVAFYREQDRMGEEGVVLVLSPAPDEDELRGVLRALRTHHPRTHWPLRVESAPELPTLPSGKVDGRALASLDGKEVHWRNRI